jgi:hypothetical protein
MAWWPVEPPRRTRVTPNSPLDAKLSVVLEHAARLRGASYALAGGPPHIPRWPDPPSVTVRHVPYTKFLMVGAVLGAIVVGPHTWGVAEAAFGRPPRPTLVGHKIGSPWHDLTPTADQVP